MSNESHYDQNLDACGLDCPMPLLKTKMQLKTMQVGEVLYITATDSGSWRDLNKFVELTANEMVAAEEAEGVYHYWIKKGA